MPTYSPSAISTGFATSLALAGCLALGACAGDANPIRDLAIASGVTGGEPKPAPDFISQSRSSTSDYVPVGTSAPKRTYRTKTPAEVKEEEAELDRVRARNEARGASARKPVP